MLPKANLENVLMTAPKAENRTTLENPSNPLIIYRKVNKKFGSQTVCRNFELEVYKGETLCIIGPSGVGKTVTTKMLIGLLAPDSGEVWFDNTNVAEFSRDEEF